MGMKRNRFEFGKAERKYHIYYCPVLTRQTHPEPPAQVATIKGTRIGSRFWKWYLIDVAEGYEYLDGWTVYPGKLADAKKEVMARQWLGPNDAKPNQGAAA